MCVYVGTLLPFSSTQRLMRSPHTCRVMQMALVHDIAECIVGDITPDQQLGKKEKYHMERVSVFCWMRNNKVALTPMSHTW